MNDLVIVDGLVVDGTGRPPRRADVGIRGGRITEIGEPGSVGAASRLDAEGAIVAPGFVDIHTHYDAQLTWDPAATPSSLHGVTSIVGGNCGFSLAPLSAESAAYLVPMLATVEGMPEQALREGLAVRWESFAGYLDALDETLVVNAGFLVGHSAVRRLVMGESAVGEKAAPEQVEEMARLVHESIDAGALGFSTSRGQAHLDHRGDPVPSRHASVAETLALCHAAGQHPGTSIETIPTIDQVFDDEAQMLLVAMSLAAGRPVNWNSLGLEQDGPARASRLAPSDAARAAGGQVVALAPCEPVFTRYSLELPFLWESIPNWAATMRLPVPERIRAFGDPAVREHLRAGAATITRKWVRWPEFTVNDVADPSLRPLVGRTVADLAAERGRSAFDVFCDVAVEGGLRVGWATPVVGGDDDGWRDLVDLLRDPRVVAGASDAGAHLDIISAFAMYTGFLGGAVRERGLLPVEEAVAMLTGRPAALYGLTDRGTLGPGNWADLVIFDPDAIGPRSAALYGLTDRGTLGPGNWADLVIFDPDAIGHGPVEIRADLPAGARRLFCEPHGVSAVLVNGVRTVADGRLTGASPGRTIRSGRDTATPAR